MIRMFTTNKHRFWHKMEVILDNGFTMYSECQKCKTRKVVQPENGYQPINWDWLVYKTDDI